MTATKDIRLVLTRGQFERMRQARYGYEPVVEFIRTAIDREIRLRTGRTSLAAHAAPVEHLPGPVDDMVELIEDGLKPDESVDKFIRSCVAAGLKLRLAERLRPQAPEPPANRTEEKVQTTACPPSPQAPGTTQGAAPATSADRIADLLRRRGGA